VIKTLFVLRRDQENSHAVADRDSKELVTYVKKLTFVQQIIHVIHTLHAQRQVQEQLTVDVLRAMRVMERSAHPSTCVFVTHVIRTLYVNQLVLVYSHVLVKMVILVMVLNVMNKIYVQQDHVIHMHNVPRRVLVYILVLVIKDIKVMENHVKRSILVVLFLLHVISMQLVNKLVQVVLHVLVILVILYQAMDVNVLNKMHVFLLLVTNRRHAQRQDLDSTCVPVT